MKPATKVIFLFVFLVLGAILNFALFHPKKQFADKPVAAIPKNETPSSTPSASKTMPALPKTLFHGDTKPAAAIERYKKIPKDGVVDFKVMNGLAVVYGDTVIGKVPKEFTEAGGLTESHAIHLWKSNEIPYAVDDTIKDKTGIQQALELFQTRTNIKFIPYVDQEDAIVFTIGKENCMSALGRVGGLQPIYLEPRCGKTEIAHEIMHALGFVHEQSRTDRDQYVEIFWQNIQATYQDQFAIVPEPLMEAYGDTPFDATSIMMYDPHIFAVDDKAETMKLKNGSPIVNAATGLSDGDVLRVNRLYRN